MTKPFQFGFIIGRFQPVHRGHEKLIDAALAIAERVLVVIGSAQESGTARNPFAANEREQWLRRIYGDRIHVLALPDLTNENDHSRSWGDYLLHAVDSYGASQRWPALDLIIEGEENGRGSWFGEERALRLGRLTFPRQEGALSATWLRTMIREGREESWARKVHPVLIESYRELQDRLLALRDLP
ncbi:adenylyltransferase/cytidyltransferase family protein [Paenibacillus methanolicus]|uniref:Nicotinamide-nucleotide adenylyltransferase n=1 Tax=Paenibacillus methanolicus TaxID=582686 RepID=A0A5S5CKM0_9BACL|nr:adenylyltransferase/cytidyltransferase family protein [Paenibacillus methanolicus]TYP79523.1 nicotinamide-nucleotide adenylyltransferase [Paenibacillus methanolicus]